MKSGSEVRLKTVVTNITEHEITIGTFLSGGSPDTTGHGFTFNVRDESGAEPRLTKLGRLQIRGEGEDEVIGKIIFRQLRPSEALLNEIVITKLFDLSRPGNYTIQVERLVDATRTYVKSNTITASVVP